MGKLELMQEKISEQRKLPNDIKEKLNSIAFINLLISISFMIFMIVVNYLFLNVAKGIFSNCIKISACTLAIFDIALFEIAYRKESVRLAVHGIELLVVCLFALSIPYIYCYINPIIVNIIMLSSIFMSIYYIAKLISIHIIEKNKYINNLSDVFEILQEDEKDSYLDSFEESDKESINISEQEIIDGVQGIEDQKNEEKQLIKNAHKKSNKKESKND